MTISKRPLIEFADLASGGTPSKSRSDYWGGEIPWLTPKDMARFNGETQDCVQEAAIGNGTRLAPENSLFIAVRGMSLHNEIRIVHPRKEMTFNQDIKAIIPKENIDPSFLYYALLNEVPKLLGSVHAAGHGTGVLSTDLLKQTPVPDFEPGYRSLIGRKLAAFDDKMELNRRMNEVLEAMARAVFRDWFVDFGPTRRKAAGITDPAAILGGLLSDPEKATPLAALFPDSFGDNGLPEGWNSFAMGDRVTVKRGGSPRPINDYIRPAGLPWVKIADATRCQGPNLAQTREFIKPEGLAKTVLLNAGSLILSNSATPGLPKFLRLDACIHDGWLYFPDTGPYSNEFLYLAFLQLREEIVAKATGSVFNNLKTDTLKQQQVIFPGSTVLDQFDEVAVPLFNLIWANEQETQTLAATRDLLLPKVMSGEIRLTGAEGAA